MRGPIFQSEAMQPLFVIFGGTHKSFLARLKHIMLSWLPFVEHLLVTTLYQAASSVVESPSDGHFLLIRCQPASQNLKTFCSLTGYDCFRDIARSQAVLGLEASPALFSASSNGSFTMKSIARAITSPVISSISNPNSLSRGYQLKLHL
jgi:hypothetical protein